VSAAGPIARPTSEEERALHGGVGLAAGLELEGVELGGEDRVRFLQNLITCDVAGLAVGRSVRGFLTSVKGGVLADATVENLGDRLRLVVGAGRGEAAAAHLARYRVIERVEIGRVPGFAACALRGEKAPDLLRALDAPVPEPGEHRECELAGERLRIRREARRRAVRFVLETTTGALSQLAARLRAEGVRLGLVELSPAALALARVKALELAWGIDYGEENFPQETGDEDAISYAKGCYLGQEVVARIHYRGGVQRLPRRVRFGMGATVSPGDELLHDGRPAGRATTLAIDPESGAVLALALIHRRAAAPGTRLRTTAGAVAEVEPQPSD